MKQITLHRESLCTGRLAGLGLLFGFAMLVVWWAAGPTPLGHALAWGVAIVAAVKFWHAIEEA